ncbi:hypothetical protein MRX96_026898 [Rhipicephalus microplus]
MCARLAKHAVQALNETVTRQRRAHARVCVSSKGVSAACRLRTLRIGTRTATARKTVDSSLGRSSRVGRLCARNVSLLPPLTVVAAAVGRCASSADDLLALWYFIRRWESGAA